MVLTRLFASTLTFKVNMILDSQMNVNTKAVELLIPIKVFISSFYLEDCTVALSQHVFYMENILKCTKKWSKSHDAQFFKTNDLS